MVKKCPIFSYFWAFGSQRAQKLSENSGLVPPLKEYICTIFCPCFGHNLCACFSTVLGRLSPQETVQIIVLQKTGHSFLQAATIPPSVSRRCTLHNCPRRWHPHQCRRECCWVVPPAVLLWGNVQGGAFKLADCGRHPTPWGGDSWVKGIGVVIFGRALSTSVVLSRKKKAVIMDSTGPSIAVSTAQPLSPKPLYPPPPPKGAFPTHHGEPLLLLPRSGGGTPEQAEQTPVTGQFVDLETCAKVPGAPGTTQLQVGQPDSHNGRQ